MARPAKADHSSARSDWVINTLAVLGVFLGSWMLLIGAATLIYLALT